MTDAFDRLKSALAGRFALEREVGRGGMAAVCLATDLKHGRPVAVKVLRPEIGAGLGPERFLREIQIAAKLHHPHIVPLYDSGRIDELLYYVMPYVEGESLRERLNRERYLPVGDAVTIATEVCDALSYAHSLGVVHRDLKPENILLESGHALVADFGVGRAIAAAGVETLTATGLAVGTPGYMSPEQAHGEKEIDQRSDIYSLGCVVYEMLAGEPPFTGISARAVMARHSIDPVPSVRTVRPTVPAALEAAVTRALAKVPADRPQTAREFSEALTRSGLAPLNAEGPAVRRGAAITAVVQTVVALARAAGAWMRVPQRLSLVPARVVVGVFENKSGDSSLDVLGNVATDWLSDGIQRIEGIEVLPAKFTLSLGSRSINVRDLAEATGAGTVVSGTYYTRNDSLTFHAHIVDARTGRLIHSLDPVVGPEQRRMDVIDSLRERVLGALALHFGAPRHVAEKGGSPPTFAAYQNYLEGVRRANEFRYRDAITHLDAALALDATFLGAWFTKGDVHYNLAGLTAATVGLSDPEVASQFAAGDAAFRVLQDARDHLSPAQRHYLDWQDAMHRGDLSGALRAARKMSAVAPDPGSRSLEALSAVRVNRFREAIKVLQAAGEPDWGWAVGTEAYHMLADHRRELSGARQARQHHPDLPLTMSLELRALAALGRLKEVNDLLDEGMSLAPQPGSWTCGSLAALGGLELRAHGYPAAANEVLQRSIDWYRRRISEPDASRIHRYGLARSLSWAGQWEEARHHFVRLLAEAPSDLDCMGYVGVATARHGDHAEALRISRQVAGFARPYPLFGQPTLWRARIATVLGERDEAVSLVREAIGQGLLPLDVAQGFGYATWLHRDTDFEVLRDYPPFRALLEARE